MCYGRDCLRKRERFPVNFPLMQFSNPFTLQRYKPDLFQESGLGETRVMDHFAELMEVLVSGPALKMRKSQCSEALRECYAENRKPCPSVAPTSLKCLVAPLIPKNATSRGRVFMSKFLMDHEFDQFACQMHTYLLINLNKSNRGKNVFKNKLNCFIIGFLKRMLRENRAVYFKV